MRQLTIQTTTPISLTRGSFVPMVVVAAIFAAYSDRAGHHSAIFLAATALVGGVGAFASLLAHEFGHTRAARRSRGVTVVRIEMMSLGAATHLAGAYRSAGDQIRVAAAGPLASLGVSATLFLSLGLPLPLPARWSLFLLALLNVGLGAIALLPMHPMDGHKLLIGLVWLAARSETRARQAVRRAGLALLGVDAVAVLAVAVERPLYGAVAAVLAGVVGVERRASHSTRLHSGGA